MSHTTVTVVQPMCTEHDFAKDPEGPCRCCNKRKAAISWVGEGSILDVVHGAERIPWCEICCLEAQIQYAEEFASKLPGLRLRLGDLLAKDKIDGQ